MILLTGADPSVQGLADFFCKEPDSKYFRAMLSLWQLLNSTGIAQKQP